MPTPSAARDFPVLGEQRLEHGPTFQAGFPARTGDAALLRGGRFSAEWVEWYAAPQHGVKKNSATQEIVMGGEECEYIRAEVLLPVPDDILLWLDETHP